MTSCGIQYEYASLTMQIDEFLEAVQGMEEFGPGGCWPSRIPAGATLSDGTNRCVVFVDGNISETSEGFALPENDKDIAEFSKEYKKLWSDLGLVMPDASQRGWSPVGPPVALSSVQNIYPSNYLIPSSLFNSLPYVGEVPRFTNELYFSIHFATGLVVNSMIYLEDPCAFIEFPDGLGPGDITGVDKAVDGAADAPRILASICEY